MSQLLQILRYLDRDDVSEVIIQTGKSLTVRMDAEFRPLSKNPVTTQQIEALLANTPLAPLVPEEDPGNTARTLAIEGKSYQVRIARRSGALQVRVEPGNARSTTAERAEPPAERPSGLPGGIPMARPSAPQITDRTATTPQITDRPTPAPTLQDAHRAVTRPVDPNLLMTPPTAPAQRPRAIGATFASLVQEARTRKASDLHVAAGRPVSMRTAGELLSVGEPLDAAAVERILTPLMSEVQKKQLQERGYVDFAIDVEGSGRLRANISRQRLGLKGSFRLVMHPMPTLDDLGLPRELSKVTTYHQGLVVIAGPNGHGKTTTLAAVIDLINSSKPHHILTVEEPVEFIHARKQSVMSQREVGLHTRTFATALKASLREDPDVIVIGELRDRETVEIALTAAETGHLVMVTMSTPSAAKTIDRLIDFFPPEDQQQVRASLAGALKFIVAQRLVPNVAGDGFVAAIELLTGVPPLWALIRDNKLFQLPSLQQRGRAFGMVRLDDSLAELVRAGKITEETALRFAENRKEMAATFGKAAQPQAPAAPPAAPGAGASAANAANNAANALKSKVGGLFGKKE